MHQFSLFILITEPSIIFHNRPLRCYKCFRYVNVLPPPYMHLFETSKSKIELKEQGSNFSCISD
jgi:hypothetical protein